MAASSKEVATSKEAATNDALGSSQVANSNSKPYGPGSGYAAF